MSSLVYVPVLEEQIKVFLFFKFHIVMKFIWIAKVMLSDILNIIPFLFLFCLVLVCVREYGCPSGMAHMWKSG